MKAAVEGEKMRYEKVKVTFGALGAYISMIIDELPTDFGSSPHSTEALIESQPSKKVRRIEVS